MRDAFITSPKQSIPDSLVLLTLKELSFEIIQAFVCFLINCIYLAIQGVI